MSLSLFDEPSQFPEPCQDTEETGFIGWTGMITSPMLLDAYIHAVFPWPNDEEHVLWFSPFVRGVLDFSDLHIPSRLKRFFKSHKFTFRIDHDFDGVIQACATVPRGDAGTWITDKIIRAYTRFHLQGFAHSFEAYNAEDMLVGGLYGIAIDRLFCGESMFFRESGASKFAFLCMIDTLKNLGLEWIDTQMVTPLTGSFGAKEITRTEYIERLRPCVTKPVSITTEQLREHAGSAEHLL
ncbi:MAG: leucyl/phenylalanyl-tRNA--protein transferase [Thermoguttaceae bacterium]|nr:leucyl/phenylalanyl-tRNA--protein transferase [Thermoguttaceae bacterium]